MSIGHPPSKLHFTDEGSPAYGFMEKWEESNRLLGPLSKEQPQKEKGAIKSADSKTRRKSKAPGAERRNLVATVLDAWKPPLLEMGLARIGASFTILAMRMIHQVFLS
jgi:hypothetical protein